MDAEDCIQNCSSKFNITCQRCILVSFWFFIHAFCCGFLFFLVVDAQSLGTTIAVGQNMQICYSLRCKQSCSTEQLGKQINLYDATADELSHFMKKSLF